MTARQREHLGVDVDTDHAPRSADDLRCDEAGLATSAAEIQNRVTRLQIGRWIAASVIPLDHFIRYYVEIAWVVANGAAERVLARDGPGLVALTHYFVNIQISRHLSVPEMTFIQPMTLGFQ
jgi:hypothetical protein